MWCGGWVGVPSEGVLRVLWLELWRAARRDAPCVGGGEGVGFDVVGKSESRTNKR